MGFSIASIGIAAVGTGVSMYGQSKAAAAGETAASNSAHEAALNSLKSKVNAVLATYKAKDIKARNATDVQYLGFVTDRQAQWQTMMGAYNVNLTKASVADEFLIGADNALFKAKGIKALAETQAGNLEAQGRRQAAETMAETNYKRVMQNDQDARQLGLMRATTGARMVAYSGSALDVLNHEEAMANIRQTAIAVLGGMHADDVQYDANTQANYVRQQASVQAQNLEHDYIRDPMADPVLQARIAQMEVTTGHDVALTREDGWRKAMLMQRAAQDSVDSILAGADQQLEDAGRYTGQQSAFEAKADYAAEAGTLQVASTGLSGLSSMLGTAGKQWGKKEP